MHRPNSHHPIPYVCFSARVARLAAPLAVALGVCVVIAAVPSRASASATPVEERFAAQGRRHRGDALVLGSSSILGGVGRALSEGLRQRGLSVYKLGVGSSGLSRPDYFDWLGRVATLPVTKRTVLAVLYLGGNDAQAIWVRPGERSRWGRKWIGFGRAAWPKLYARRATELAKALCKRGVRQVVFILPADVGKRRLQRRLAQVRRGQTRGASRVRCATAIAARGDLARIVASRAHPKRRSRAHRRARPRLRQPDGVHMTNAGAARLWQRVSRRVLHRADKGVKLRLQADRRRRLARQRVARRARLKRQRALNRARVRRRTAARRAKLRHAKRHVRTTPPVKKPDSLGGS